MNAALFQELVASLTLGKNLPDSIYLHRSALNHACADLHQLVEKIQGALKLDSGAWDVVKFFKKHYKLSLLSYPDFEKHLNYLLVNNDG